ncbi:MAG: IS4/Tn5 family transposase DNA-binding protein, partial [Phycisphaerae bacterium]
MEAWINSELCGCDLGDQRLNRRLSKLMEDLSRRVGKGIPLACQDWAATKAAYRFLSNGRVDEGMILQGHLQSTRTRSDDASGRLLVLHDTTEFSYQREDTLAIGKLHKTMAGVDPKGRPRWHTLCGLLMHSSLVVTTEGLPLGLAGVKFWTRKKFVTVHGPDGRSEGVGFPAKWLLMVWY